MAERLFYKDIGQGKPLICLHAYALDHSTWLSVADRLKGRVRMILPDLRGHGCSPAPTEKYSMRSMAEDILRIMDKLVLDQAALAGNSMGGYVAMAFAEHFSHRLAGLALVASHVYADTPDKKAARLEDIQKMKSMPSAQVLSGMAEKLSLKAHVVEYCRSLIQTADPIGMMGVLGGMASRSDTAHVLSALSVPAVIISGQEDQFIPLDISRKMVQLMKHPCLVEIPKAGHLPMMDSPETTANALREFVNQIEENN
jgi:3-oxoadipate enol-lactonase